MDVKAGHLQTCMLNYTPLGENSWFWGKIEFVFFEVVAL